MSSSTEEENPNDGIANNNNNSNGLIKGKWSKVEDQMLINYVAEYGTGKWDKIRKKTNLARCGKSCRLRWLNHLRPNMKKGPFSEEEEKKVIELYALYGPNWCAMTNELPGRSDNAIKNFWHAKKRKLGKDIWPKPKSQHIMQDDHELNVNGESSLSGQQVNVSQLAMLGLPLMKFDNQNLHGNYSPTYDGIINKNLVDDSNMELTKLVDDSNMLYNDMGGTSTSNHNTSTMSEHRIDIETSPMHQAMEPSLAPLPPCIEDCLRPSYMEFDEYPQNLHPPQPMETKYQMPQPLTVCPYIRVTSRILEGSSDDSRVRSSEVNLVDEKCKKPNYQLSSYMKFDEYPQKPLPQPMETQYHIPQPLQVISLYIRGSRILEGSSDASRMRSFEVNLVDKKGKKPINQLSNDEYTQNLHPQLMETQYHKPQPQSVSPYSRGSRILEGSSDAGLMHSSEVNLVDENGKKLDNHLSNDEYLQNPHPQPLETQYHMPQPKSVSPYSMGSRILEGPSDASHMHSSEVNLVDKKEKKPISFKTDVEANHQSESAVDDLVTRFLTDDEANHQSELEVDDDLVTSISVFHGNDDTIF